MKVLKEETSLLTDGSKVYTDFIYESTNYDSFKFIRYNREVRIKQKLRDSFKKYGFKKQSPILITKDGFIYDGQHRFRLAKEMNIPFFWKFIDKLSTDKDILKSITVHQNTQQKWITKDILKAFVDKGNKNYSKLRKYNEEYNLPLSFLYKSINTLGTGAKACDDFLNGDFRIDSDKEKVLIKVLDCIELVLENKPSLISFIKSVYSLNGLLNTLNNESLDLNIFKHKLIVNIEKIEKQADAAAYTKMFQYIYNFKSRKG